MGWISSTSDKQWVTETQYSEQSGREIKIGEAVGKPIFGFGCCISEICAMAIETLSVEEQEYIYDQLFSPENCGFEFCRLSIGANDFAESWYSCNETDGDYEMKNFSIDRDRKHIIPAIKKAMERSKNIKFFASPWSPPTWMKFPKAYNYGRFVRTPENYKAYALYFKKFVEEYAKEGINVSQIHFQNEYYADQKFPSCLWDADAIEEFFTGYLFDELKDVAEVWLGTINCGVSHNQFLNRFMQNDKFRNNIKGAAFQWAGGAAIEKAQEDYPELDTIHSECECGDGNNSWEHAIHVFDLYRHYFNKGARANVYWNMALDNDGLSTWGWRQNSLISVKEGEYKFNYEFYVVKHFAQFIKKGAVMLKNSGELASNTIAFMNPDGSKVAVILNPFEFEKTVTLEGKNYCLKPLSFNTITF